MEDWKKQLNNYLEKLEDKIDKTNADLVKEFCKVYRSLPTEPGARRILASAQRLKTISLMLNKPLDSLIETQTCKH